MAGEVCCYVPEVTRRAGPTKMLIFAINERFSGKLKNLFSMYEFGQKCEGPEFQKIDCYDML